MELKEALDKIKTLESENATLKSKNDQLTTQNQQLTDDLALANSEVNQEREMLVKEARKHYMDQRKENMSAEDLAAYEKTLEKFNLRELKAEVDKMKIITEAMEDDGAETRVTPGQKTQQDDSTQEEQDRYRRLRDPRGCRTSKNGSNARTISNPARNRQLDKEIFIMANYPQHRRGFDNDATAAAAQNSTDYDKMEVDHSVTYGATPDTIKLSGC